MNIDWSLLKPSLVSRINESEQQLLREWLEESPEHRDLYRNMKVFLTDREAFLPDEERLSHFKADYEKRLQGTRYRHRLHYFSQTLTVAASLLVVCGLALFVWLQSGENGPLKTVQEKNVILPGSSKALLVTNEGKTIQLNSEVQEVVIAGDMKVKNDADALIYSESGIRTEQYEENQLIIPRGGEYSVQLADGTRVWLNSASELKYPVQFSGKQRRVYLKGEAYFQVAHDSEKAFIVVTDEIEVKVYGTEFNINTRAAGYVQTTLVRGSVSVRTAGLQEHMLEPDQMAQFHRGTGKIDVLNVDVNNYIGWKSGVYVFENRTIEQIMEELSLWYDVEVFFKSNGARNQRFSGSLPRYREIESMLAVIEKTSHVGFEVRGKTIVVK